MSFWDIIWFIILSFAFIAYLMVLFNIIFDLFRDHQVSGLGKAVWMILLIFFPFLTAIVYLIVRGGGMAERHNRDVQAVQASQAEYIKSVAGSGGTSPTEEITKAKGLLDAGAITQAEFDSLKAKALS